MAGGGCSTSGSCHDASLSTSVNRVPAFSQNDCVIMWNRYPDMRPTIAAFVRQFYPKCGLGRQA